MCRAVLTRVIGVTGAPVSLGSRLVIAVVRVVLEALPLPLASALALAGEGGAVMLTRVLRARTKRIFAGQAAANDLPCFGIYCVRVEPLHLRPGEAVNGSHHEQRIVLSTPRNLSDAELV